MEDPSGRQDDAPKIPYDWARVECPTCGAQPDQRCRTLTTGRSTDAHDRRRQIGDLHRYQIRRQAGCSHLFRHTVYGAENPADNGTCCAICGVKL